jgi:hypothetical protein
MSVSGALANGRQTFREHLAFGQIAETQIAKWIMSRGGVVLPIYDVEIESGKGPRVFSTEGEFVAPDLLVATHGRVHWIEAKHKSVFTWHRITSRWVTGIDLHHYEQYKKVAEIMPWPIWLLFLHRESKPAEHDIKHNCPTQCPTGLFGSTLERLAKIENHRHANWGRYGMVYWAHDKLQLIATLNEFYGAG